MEQTLIDDIVVVLEEHAIQNEFDGTVRVPLEEVAKALEKMVIIKLNQQKRELKKQKL
jgi:hypothetical protein